MSATVSVKQPAYDGYNQSNRLRPSFRGLVRGELFKVRHQWATWIMLVLFAIVNILPYLIELTRPNLATAISADPLQSSYSLVEIGLGVIRIFSGLFILVITARMITLEYQLGTVRVLLSRGVGRLQLLFAKLCAVALVGMVLLIIGFLLTSLMTILVVAIGTGNLNAFHALTSQFWSDVGVYVLTILLNMGVSILLATAAAVVSRSAAFGLSLALIFFPIDNIGTIIMDLAFRLTNNDFWLNVTAYLLGPNLNVIAGVLVNNRFRTIGTGPVVETDPLTNQVHGINVDGTHTLVVVVVYAIIFAVAAIWLTRQRDVRE
jgi:ABC-2 type transport system permease protein